MVNTFGLPPGGRDKISTSHRIDGVAFWKSVAQLDS